MLKRVLFLIIAVLLLCGFRPAPNDNKKIKIAVLDFQQNGQFDTPDVGKMVAEWFTTSLVETRRFDIIERRLLQQILNEQKIGNSGLVESSSASRIGKILGVKTVVTGTVLSFDGRLEVNARVINVETGSIIAAEKVEAASAARLTDLVRQISVKILRAFPLEGHVVKRDKERVIIDVGKQGGVRPGMSFSVFTATPITDPDTGETLDMERVENGVVVIREVREKTADGRIVREASAGAIKARQQVRMQGEAQAEAQAQPQPQEALPAPEPVPVAALHERPAPAPRAAQQAPADRQSTLSRLVSVASNLVGLVDDPDDDPRLPAPGQAIQHHNGDIKAIAFSPSGRLVATAGNDNLVILWDARTWQPVATLHGHRSEVKTVRFSNDERYLASGSEDDTAIIWDVQKRSELQRFRVGRDVNAVAFSPDGTLVATGSNAREIFLWDIRTGAKVCTIAGKNDVYALAFSPNGKILAATGDGGFIQLWSVETGALFREPEGHHRDTHALTFSKDGRLLITGSNDDKIIYWDVATGTKVRVLEGHGHSVRELALSGDGSRLVSGDGNRRGGIIVWNAQNSELLRRMDSQEDFDALALSPDGCTLLLGCSKSLVVRRIK